MNDTDLDQLQTEWNRSALFVNKQGQTILNMNLPPFAPRRMTVQGKEYARSEDDNATQNAPIVYHEA